jgi:outer membrane protein TolC
MIIIYKMKRISNKRSLLLFLTLMITFYALGQQMHDSLALYLEIAAKNNPAVQQRFNEYQAALQKVPQAGSLPDPELSIGFFPSPMELVNGNLFAEVRLMQMFPWLGVLKSAKDEMSLMAKAKFELYRDTRLQVYYDVRRTWYELFKIQKDISISEKNLEILKTIERLSTVKFQSAPSPESMQPGSGASLSGTPGLADLYRIQMEKGELQNDIDLLRNNTNTIVAQFNSYLNRPSETPVFIPDTLMKDNISSSMNSVSDSILTNNSMLSMLEYEKQSLEARERMVRKMAYPMVGLGLNYSVTGNNEMSASSMNGKDMIMPMISFTLPVYRKKYKASVREAELLKTAVSDNYTAAVNLLKTEYYQAIQLYQDALRRERLYENQFLLASKSLDIMLNSYSAATSSLTDLLRIRQQVHDYEFKQAEATTDLNTAVALLKKLMASSK